MRPETNARLKLNRCGSHIDELEGHINAWLGTDAYTITREVDPKTGNTVRRAQIKESPPTELSLIVGDAIQNLRAALDHTVYALADRHSGPLSLEIEESLMFPIVGHINRKGRPANGADIFKSAVGRGQLAGVPDPAIEVIETMQPYYHYPDWTTDGFRFTPLWRMHDLSRIDKHRRIHLTTAYLDLQYVSAPAGLTPKVAFGHAHGPVQDGDVLVSYSGAEEGVDAVATRGVALNETGGVREVGVADNLKFLKGHAEWVVGVLEQFL